MGFGRHPFFFFEKKYNKYEQRETVPSPSIRSSVPRRRSRARRRGLSPFVPRTSVALPRAHAGTRARTIERPKDAGRSSPVPRAFFGESLGLVVIGGCLFFPPSFLWPFPFLFVGPRDSSPSRPPHTSPLFFSSRPAPLAHSALVPPRSAPDNFRCLADRRPACTKWCLGIAPCKGSGERRLQTLWPQSRAVPTPMPRVRRPTITHRART